MEDDFQKKARHVGVAHGVHMKKALLCPGMHSCGVIFSYALTVGFPNDTPKNQSLVSSFFMLYLGHSVVFYYGVYS
jgi:hypothetical protein